MGNVMQCMEDTCASGSKMTPSSLTTRSLSQKMVSPAATTRSHPTSASRSTTCHNAKKVLCVIQEKQHGFLGNVRRRRQLSHSQHRRQGIVTLAGKRNLHALMRTRKRNVKSLTLHVAATSVFGQMTEANMSLTSSFELNKKHKVYLGSSIVLLQLRAA